MKRFSSSISVIVTVCSLFLGGCGKDNPSNSPTIEQIWVIEALGTEASKIEIYSDDTFKIYLMSMLWEQGTIETSGNVITFTYTKCKDDSGQDIDCNDAAATGTVDGNAMEFEDKEGEVNTYAKK